MLPIQFDSSVSAEMHDKIVVELHQIEAQYNVRVLFAIESGSRAWGFPSPDSDYDARFVYAHSADWYLSLTPGRDVIELPIEDELDINGWDIRKALNLLLKPNPVLLEWLSSPIRYLWDKEVCNELLALSEKVSHGRSCLHHYFNIGESHWRRNIDGNTKVRLKRYFYVLRPVMALRWIRMRPDLVPPMNFQELMAGVDLPDTLQDKLAELLLAKAKSKELGVAERIPLLDEFITDELRLASALAKGPFAPRPTLYGEADALFREIVKA